MPPMPTKWMVPIESGSALMPGSPGPALLAEMRLDHVGEPRRRVGTPRGAGGGGGADERAGIVHQSAEAVAQPGRVKFRLRLEPAAAEIGERPRVGRLVVVDGTRKRHEDGRSSGGREFGDRGSPSARDDEVRRRDARRDVGEERRQVRVDAGRVVARANTVEILGAALLSDPQPAAQTVRQSRYRWWNEVAEGAGAERAAEDQQIDFFARRLVGNAGQRGDRLPHGIAGQNDPARSRHTLGALEAQCQRRGVGDEKAVGAAKDRVLLVQKHRRTPGQQPCREHRGYGRITAETDDGRDVDAGQYRARLYDAMPKAKHRARRLPRAAPGNAGARNDKAILGGGDLPRPLRRARVGHEHDATAARHQLAGERLGGKEMTAGAAGGDRDRAHRGAPHASSPWLRRRVRASSMPISSAIARAEDPP